MTWHTQGTPATIGEHNPGVWVQGSHEKNSSTLKCPSQNTRNISSETYMFLLGMTTKAGVHHIYYMLYHSVRSFSISQVDVHLEHLYPNPLRRLPSAILCEHHVQKPPAELLQKHQWTLLSGSYFCKSWATRMLLANPPHPIHPTKVGLCGTIPTFQIYIRENDLTACQNSVLAPIPEFCAGSPKIGNKV